MNRDYHDLARILGMQGRYGDTLVAHISPSEAAALRQMGGAGTRNPRTGLLEFWANGGGPGGAGFGGSGVHGGADTGGGARSGGRGAVGNHSGAASSGATGGDIGGSSSGSGKDDGSGGSYQDSDSGGWGTNDLAGGLGTDVFGQDSELGQFIDRVGGFLSDVADGIGTGVTVGGMTGTPIGLLGGAALGAAYGAYHNLTKDDDSDGGMNRNDGTPGVGEGIGGAVQDGNGPGFHAGTGDGSGGTDTGNGGGGVSSGPGGPGNPNYGGLSSLNHASVAQNAQQSNAGGGLLAALDPAIAGNIASRAQIPAGLLPYLAMNPPGFPGYTGTSRFGTGVIPAYNYYRPLA
jgi:hypothetical protein